MRQNFYNKNGWNASMPYPAKEEMQKFLINHFRYNTMRTWNQSTSYANNVKIYNLDLPDAGIDMDKAFDFINSEHDLFNYDVEDLITQFKDETGYTAAFNGRSSGYLVMYETTVDDKTGRKAVMPGRSIDMYLCEEDFDDWTEDEIKDRYALVKRFDTLCDEIRNCLIDHLQSSKTIEIEYLMPQVRRLTLTPDYEDETVNVIFQKDVPDTKISVIYDETDQMYKGTAIKFGVYNITGNTMEQCVMYVQKAILDKLESMQK